MKVDRNLIYHFGSGRNPDDQQCMDGYNWFVNTFDGAEPVTVTLTEQTVINHYDQGLTAKHVKTLCLRLASRLKESAEAIRMGGYSEELPVWRFKDQEFTTLEQAQAAKAQIETDIRAKPFEHVNVLRHIKTPQGSTTASIKAWEQIRPDAKITVFDSKTGRHNEPANVAAEVERVLQQHLDRAMAEPIFRKIRDTQEGFEAWEPVK